MLKNRIISESLGYESQSPAKGQIFPAPKEACHPQIHVESLVLVKAIFSSRQKPFVQFLEIPAFQREPFL